MDAPPVRNPIVLVHGILGFTELRIAGVKIGDYFRGVRDFLRQAGCTVLAPPQLNSAGSVEDRAGDLREYLDNNEEAAGQAVHLIAHSMGGLDARFMISQLGMAKRVLSLTTLGTPHAGTLLADKGVAVLRTVIDLVRPLGIDLTGLKDLTTTRGAEFNEKNPDKDDEGVRYFSVAGIFEPKRPSLLDPFAGDLLLLPHDIIVNEGDGPNDGLVPLESAKHGTFLGTWPADHFRLINWATNVVSPAEELQDDSILQRYLGLVKNLAAQGF